VELNLEINLSSLPVVTKLRDGSFCVVTEVSEGASHSTSFGMVAFIKLIRRAIEETQLLLEMGPQVHPFFVRHYTKYGCGPSILRPRSTESSDRGINTL